MNREILEKPFPPELVKTRKGPHGELSYVEGAHYVRRLNDAFDGRWNWKILSHDVSATEVVVHGVLEADGITRHAFGGSSLTVNKSTGEVLSVGDDIKAAATDALKKACSLLGIGLDLYTSWPEQQRPAHATQAPRTASTDKAPTAPSAREQPAVVRIDRNRLTAKQLKAIYAIGHAQRIPDAELKRRSRERYGVLPEFLSMQDASAFIDSLKVA